MLGCLLLYDWSLPRCGVTNLGFDLLGPSFGRFLTTNNQKTREGCGCFRGLFGGSRGKLPGSPRKIAGKFFPNSRNATNSRISGTGKGKHAGNLCPHCRDLVPTFRAGCFLKSTVPAFSSFSETNLREVGNFHKVSFCDVTDVSRAVCIARFESVSEWQPNLALQCH